MSHNYPVIFDLDGTIIRSDITHELCIKHIKSQKIIGIFQLLIWIFKGKNVLKQKLDDKYADLYDVTQLPYNIDLIENKDFENKKKYLISGSPKNVVKRVSNFLKIFEDSHGSSIDINLTGNNKASYLEDTFPEGFIYVGNSLADISIWKKSVQAFTVNNSKSLTKKAKANGIDLNILDSIKHNSIFDVLKSLRMHQWSKNILLLAVPFMNLQFFETAWISTLFITFISLSLVASSTYLFNDLFDIDSDRAHRSKKHRPLAAGGLSIPFSIVLMTLIYLFGILLSTLINESLVYMLILYSAISIVYSFYFKTMLIVDVITLSGLFCYRVFLGAYILNLEANLWFLLSIGFLFLSLALGKRFLELNSSIDKNNKKTQLSGRGYQIQDIPFILSAGLAASFVSIIVILIYLMMTMSAVIKSDLSIIIIITAITWWVMRFWVLVSRGRVNDDPIIFAIKDNKSRLILLLLVIVVTVEQLSFIS